MHMHTKSWLKEPPNATVFVSYGISTRLCCAISQEKVDEAYRDQQRWTRMSIMSTAGAGYFSSDRTIRQYAGVRPAEPCAGCELCQTAVNSCLLLCCRLRRAHL